MKEFADLVDIQVMRSMIERRIAIYNHGKDKPITVQFVEDKDELETATTTPDTITIPLPNPPMTMEGLDLLYGYMVHETGHHSRPEIFDIIRKGEIDTTSPIGGMLNMIEDQSMEREIATQYIGDRKALSTSMMHHCKKQENAIRKFTENNPDKEVWTEDNIKAVTAFLIGAESRKDWDYISTPAFEQLKEVVPQAAKDLTDELIREGWADKVAGVRTTEEAFKLSIQMYKRLYPDASDEELQELQDKALSGEPGEGDKEESSSNKSTKSGKGNSENGKGAKGKPDKGEGEDGVEPPDEPEVFSWRDMTFNDHDNFNGHPAVVDWTGHSGGNVALFPNSEVENIVAVESDTPCSNYMPTNADARALGNRIRMWIQASSRKKITPERTHGHLNRRDIIRLALPPMDKGEWNKKIFYTKEWTEYPSTAVGILVDWSRSMSGSKMEIAAQATGSLLHTFERVLRIPTMVAAFTTSYPRGHERPLNCLIKDFNTRGYTEREIASKFAWFRGYTNGNADADSIMWMYNKLSLRKEQRKILIVLTDGAPTESRGHASATLKATCKAIEERPNFSLGAIGIKHTGVKHYYKNYKLIDNVELLNEVMLELMKEMYTNERRG